MFSAKNRNQTLGLCSQEFYDLIVIGGGITGCGIALDASSRGLKVLLIDKSDFASGTSSRSTKLIHGGLRYLKQFDFTLVHETGTERAVIHKLAPNLCVPEKMLLPLQKGGNYGKLGTSIGLKIYDLLARVRKEDKRKMLTKDEALFKEPLLSSELLIGAGYYAEYRTDDARLSIEVLKKAVEYGAKAFNYLKLTGFVLDKDGIISGIKTLDSRTGTNYTFRSRICVSATGPWVDQVNSLSDISKDSRLHLTKGAHLVVPFNRLPLRQAVYFDVPDGRMIFAIPRGGHCYIGTTDTNYRGSLDRVVVTSADRNYLLKAVNRMFPRVLLTPDDIISAWAGLRVLIHEEGKSPSELSRREEIFESSEGLISIAGGKLTGYRLMARKIVDKICHKLEMECKRKFKVCHTDEIALGKESFASPEELKEFSKIVVREGGSVVESQEAADLLFKYGKAALQIISKARELKSLYGEFAIIMAELHYCVEEEMVLTAEDFFCRRSSRLHFDIYSVFKSRELIIHSLKELLNTPDAIHQKDIEQLEQAIQDATNFYENELILESEKKA